MVSTEILRSLSCFAGLSAENLKAVAAIAEERDFKTGDTLWREGDPVHCLFIVRQGEIDVIYQLQSGKQCIVDTVVGGELTGWSALVEPYRHTATCVVRMAGRGLCIKATEIRTLCEKNPSIGHQMLMQVARTLGSRLQGARAQLAASS